ncbi:hypothetical protein RBU61_08990 [Tissierella sp. MB52-C2]|uniref:hypothetical protein n=1 Tax=Tissierella sp. MB52-C2 TaxID=3070999 RepID=UPI00280A73FC|nr:hypothetical protein [Tissierella sp. MB52-C2]WMM26801.1 hypothetical protein RBU61_08990 [Tissierella sp. MB52-C2]
MKKLRKIIINYFKDFIKQMMRDLYKYFGQMKEENQEMYSIANIFHEIGTKEEKRVFREN